MSESKQLEFDASDGEQVLDLVQQGLLPLPLKAILAARLVCKHWQTHIGCLVPKLTLPYDVWALNSVAAEAAAASPVSTGDSSSDDDGDDDEEKQEEQEESKGKRARKCIARAVGAAASQASSSPAVAGSTSTSAASTTAAAPVGAKAAVVKTGQPTVVDKDTESNPAAAATPAEPAAMQPPGTAVQHPLRQLHTSFPCCKSVTLLCRNLVPQPAVVSASLQLLGQLPRLDCLTLQGSMSPGPWRLLGPLLGTASPVLQVRLRHLTLSGLDLPDPGLLEVLLGPSGLTAVTCLHLHASMKSPALQTAHLEALAAATQLQQLMLWVYQSTVRCLLDPLVQLTALQHLDLAYKGIFSDTRPVLSEPAALGQLSLLTSLSSGGLASPLLPQPTGGPGGLQQLSITGLTKRLHHSAVSSIAACSSLHQVRLEAGKRGVAAVAAEHLHLLAPLQQLTSLVVAVSKGSLSSSQSSQQLLSLSGLGSGRLQSLALTADHRLAVATPLLVGLAQQWPQLKSLRLSKFGPTEGFAGLGALTGLTALSLRPGLGTGKLLQGLREGLTPLEQLRRLHVDFCGSLRLEHVEAIADACSNRLLHLSLTMRGSSIGSKAMVAIAQLSQLTSLQLLSTLAGALSGPPATAALRSMTALRWLSVQAPEDAGSQQPVELAEYVGDGIQGLQGLQELRLWLGSGAEARRAGALLLLQAHQELDSCKCVLLQEPERALL